MIKISCQIRPYQVTEDSIVQVRLYMLYFKESSICSCHFFCIPVFCLFLVVLSGIIIPKRLDLSNLLKAGGK